MRVLVAGGGPAGLFLAILLKRRRPDWRVAVRERNPRGATFGWGVVFSDRTLSDLAQPDPETWERLAPQLQTWDNVDVVHRGEKVSIRGNRFSGLARVALLAALEERCLELGVDLAWESPLGDPCGVAGVDLLVGADGIGSAVREAYREAFEPSLEPRRNRYVWYGTPHLFHGLTLTFRTAPLDGVEGVFVAHSYKYSPELSTFIVECDEATWTAAALGERPEPESRELLARVFADDLAGAPLLSNASRWIRFATVRNRRWWHHDAARGRNVVLLGDALHTAHFSIGSGTKLALEDAVALADALVADDDPAAALAAFEAARRPAVERLQAAAQRSLEWFENARGRLHLDPLALALDTMTRSERVDVESLRRRDPAFVARVEAAGLL